MRITTGGFTRNPLRGAIFCGGVTIESGCNFREHERSCGFAVVNIGTKLLGDFFGTHTKIDGNVRGLQLRNSIACHLLIRVNDSNDDPRNSCGDHCIGAWGSAAHMATRFERDIKSSPSCCITGLLQCVHFGMGTPNRCGCPGADDLAVTGDNDGANPRIRRSTRTYRRPHSKGEAHRRDIVAG